jgi:hypothetical protein
MQIVVEPTCGLGNQLFQYAAGRCLAKRYGASLRIAHQPPPMPASDGDARPVLLQHFAIPVPIQQPSLIDRLAASEPPRLPRIGRSVRRACQVQLVRQSRERCLLHQEIQVAGGTRTVYLQGFFQDYSMVREVEPELRSELRLVEPLHGRNLEVATRIAAARNPVSVHLRRADYSTAPGELTMLPIAYYEHAISHILDQDRRSTFFVFSDEVAFAKDWLSGDPRFVVVDHNDEASAQEDLRLMSLCRHHIIANSTLSWWGAWLNSRRDKQVLAPARWLGFDTSEIAIACPEWTLLDAALPRRVLPMAARA